MDFIKKNIKTVTFYFLNHFFLKTIVLLTISTDSQTLWNNVGMFCRPVRFFFNFRIIKRKSKLFHVCLVDSTGKITIVCSVGPFISARVMTNL